MTQVPVLPTVMGAYAFMWAERRQFRVLALPMIVLPVAIAALAALVLVPALSAGPAYDLPWRPVLSSAVGLAMVMLWVMFSVAWHRRYLVPGMPTTIAGALRWGRPQTRYLMVVLGIIALTMGVYLLTGLSGLVLSAGTRQWAFLPFLTAMLLAVLFYARMSMLFPAVAIDDALSLRDCWRLTRENSWRLLLVMVLVEVPIGIVASLIQGPLDALTRTGGIGAGFIAGVIQTAIWLVGVALGVTVLSIAYATLRAGPQEAEAPPPATESPPPAKPSVQR